MAMTSTIGRRARLRLTDPDAGYGSRLAPSEWPVVEGRFVAEIPGMHGLRWYLFELERDLPSGFDPLYMRRQSSETALHYLLLWPAPAIPTSETPENFIGDALERGEVVPVGVSVGAEPQDLTFAINTDELSRFPYVCSGDLEAFA